MIELPFGGLLAFELRKGNWVEKHPSKGKYKLRLIHTCCLFLITQMNSVVFLISALVCQILMLMGNGYFCNGERKIEMEWVDGMKCRKHVGSFCSENGNWKAMERRGKSRNEVSKFGFRILYYALKRAWVPAQAEVLLELDVWKIPAQARAAKGSARAKVPLDEVR